MTLFNVQLDPALVAVVDEDQNHPLGILQKPELDTSLISTRDVGGDGSKPLAPDVKPSEPIAPPPPNAATTASFRNGAPVLKKSIPLRVPMLQRARTTQLSTFWLRDKDKRSQAVNSAKASNSLSLKLSSNVAPIRRPYEMPPATTPPLEEKPLDDPAAPPSAEKLLVRQESCCTEMPKLEAQTPLSSLLQPILALFPPPQSTALAPAIDLTTPDAPPSPTSSEEGEVGDKTVGSDDLEPFTIHRPRVLEPIRESTAARRAYTFDWKIDVFGESPVAVKGQRTKYPKHHQLPNSNAPVLPPIPACAPLDFDAASSAPPPPPAQVGDSYEQAQNDNIKRKESMDSIRRKVQSPLLPLALFRAARRNRSRSTASFGTMFSSSSGVPSSFRALFSSSDARSSSFATFFSDPSLVSITSGVSSFEHDEVMTPFGSEIVLGHHQTIPAGMRMTKDRDPEAASDRERQVASMHWDDGRIENRRSREAERSSPSSLNLSSPTYSIRRAIDAMGLGSPSLPMELVDALRSNPELHTLFHEDILAGDMELSNALTSFSQAQARGPHAKEGLETGEMESFQEHEEDAQENEVEMESGSGPVTPLTPRSVPEDDSDDD